ncbi:uncharacterized protein LOC134256569 [Saccostrea cucullata]|uniref:uncharacterized protein LOC134256569 n=1 Tax=Saccostrea cuccullata TaxID=36930 RepID=UPI002ED67B17
MADQVVSPVSVENGKNSSRTLEQILHYPILMLKVGGYFIDIQGAKPKVAGKIILNVVYMLILVSGIIRILTGFVIYDEFSDKLTGRIVFAVAYISNTIMFPVFIVAFSRHLPEILSKFGRFQGKYGFVVDCAKMKRVTTVVFAFMVISVIVTVTCDAVLTSSRVLDESGLFISRFLPFQYNHGFLFDLANIIDAVACLHWTLLLDAETTVIFVFLHLIIKEFQGVTRQIDTAKAKDNMSALELGRLRQKHHEVAELLETANSVIQPNVLLNYMLTIPSICFGVYGIVHSTFGVVNVIILVFIFVMQLIGMNLVTALGAKINSEINSHGKKYDSENILAPMNRMLQSISRDRLDYVIRVWEERWHICFKIREGFADKLRCDNSFISRAINDKISVSYSRPFSRYRMADQVVSPVSVEKGKNSSRSLEQILHYPILMLKMGGYYIDIHGAKPKVAGKIILNVVYMLILVSGIIRILTGFVIYDEFSDKLMGRIVFAVAYISNTIMFPVFIVAFSRHLPEILSKFGRFQRKYGFVVDCAKMKRMTTLAFVLMVISVLITGMCEAVITSSRVLEEAGLFISRLLPFQYNHEFLFDLANIIDTVACLHWTLLLDAETTVIFVILHLIIKEFQDVTRQIDTAKAKDNMSALELGRLRQKHHDVTELLQTANSVIQPNVLLNYMLTIPSICFGVYGIVHSTLGVVDVMILVFIFVVQLIGMNLVTALGAKINSEAHSALRSLFAFSLENLSIDAQHQLQMFISQLTSQTIGINVYGLFTMDGSTFLMIFGTVITYTVVVLQIQAGSCNVSHNVNTCNCTI